jgi:hypothetical protein
MMKLRIGSSTACFAAAAILCAGAAHGQMAGTYSGTQANGATFSLTVTQKKTSFELSGLGVGISTKCPDGEAIDEDTGLGFAPVPIPQPKFTFDLLANPELYVKVVMDFDDVAQTVSGKITATVPALDKFTQRPRRSETCISAQTFTAKLGAQAPVPVRTPRLVVY